MAMLAVKIKSSLTVDQTNIAAVLDVMVKLFRNKGEYESVEALYREMLGIYEKQREAEHPSTATILYGLASYRPT